MLNKMPRKILIVVLSGLGNMILFHTVIKKLKEAYSWTAIDLMTEQFIVKTLFEDSGFINKYWYWKDNVRSRLKLLADIRKENYDILITTFESGGWKLAVFSKLTGIPVTIGYKKNRWYDSLYRIRIPIDLSNHEIINHFKILEVMSISSGNLKIELGFKSAKYTYLEKHLNNSKVKICIHAGSSDNLAQKRWCLEKFIKVAERLFYDHGAQIFFIGGDNEVEMTMEIEEKAKFPVSVLIGKLELWETAYIIERCDLLISNDSGLMHLGAALGRPVLSIFGPTDIVKNHPWSEKAVVVSKNMACAPCNFKKPCQHNMNCLEQISIEDITRESEKILKLRIGS